MNATSINIDNINETKPVSMIFIILICVGSCWCSCYIIYVIIYLFRCCYIDFILPIYYLYYYLVRKIRNELSINQKRFILYIYQLLFGTVINPDTISYILDN